jgi:hypothetical protein
MQKKKEWENLLCFKELVITQKRITVYRLQGEVQTLELRRENIGWLA